MHHETAGHGRTLSIQQVQTLAESLKTHAGTEGITLTGGEPLLRADLEDLTRILRKNGMKVALATNGTLLSRDRALSLVDSGIEHFDIGFTNPLHETVMGVTHAVGTLATVTASICINRENYRKTGLRIRTAAALGADSVCLNRFVPTGRGRFNRKALNLNHDELLLALELAQQSAETCPVHIYAGIPIEPAVANGNDFPAIQFSTCRCGETKWAVDCSGNLRTCEQNSRIMGNLLETSFTEALQRHSVEIREFRKAAESGCRFLE